MEWYCLVTLTDLQTRRAGLSASAELLVKIWWKGGICAIGETIIFLR